MCWPGYGVFFRNCGLQVLHRERKMRIGVSGAGGKIGVCICTYLGQFLPEAEIIGGSRKESETVRALQKTLGGFRWQCLDLKNKASLADFSEELDLFINAAGSALLSENARREILEKMPMIEVGYESDFEALNGKEFQHTFLYGVGTAPGFTGILSRAVLEKLEENGEKAAERKLWYLVREEISRSAAEDMANLFVSTGGNESSECCEKEAEYLPLFKEAVYPFQYYDEEAAAVDRLYGIQKSEIYMLREDGDLYHIAARYAGNKAGLAEYFVKASGAAAAESQMIRVAAEASTAGGAVTVVLEGPSQSALSGCTCAAAAASLLCQSSREPVSRLAEYRAWKAVFHKVTASGVFRVNEWYERTMEGLGEEEDGEF